MKKILLIIVCIVCVIIGFLLNLEKNSFKSAIEAIEESRGTHIDYLVLQKDIDNGRVVFYLRNINDGQQVVSAEFVRKTILGWKWVFGGGHSAPKYTGTDQEMKVDESWSYQYLPSTEGSEFGKSPFPMLFGLIKNQDITSIVVRDLMNFEEQEAEIVQTNSSVRLWYVFVTEKQGGKFTITANSKDGKKVSVKNIDEKRYN